MSKILYIEDELIRNIPGIKKLFNSLLDSTGIRKLDELAHSTAGQSTDVTRIFNTKTELDICTSFPEALHKITANHRDYDLFIIDRDLSLNPYASEMQRITGLLANLEFPNPTDLMREYLGREGDLLLLILLRINRDYKGKIFLLTLNTPEGLQSMKEFRDVLEVTDFPLERIIEKNSVKEAEISKALQDLPALAIQNRYRKECSILRKWFNENEVNLYVQAVESSENYETRIDFLQKIRPILEKLLVAMATMLHENNARYWEEGAEHNLRVMDFVKSMDYIDQRWGIPYNNVVKQSLFSIWKISSDYGNHPNANPQDVTLNTVDALFCQMNDVIPWFDHVMETLKKGTGSNRRE